MSDISLMLQNEISRGELSFASIAKKFQVPIQWVYDANDLLCDMEQEEYNDTNWRVDQNYSDVYNDIDAEYDNRTELETDYQ